MPVLKAQTLRPTHSLFSALPHSALLAEMLKPTPSPRCLAPPHQPLVLVLATTKTKPRTVAKILKALLPTPSQASLVPPAVTQPTHQPDPVPISKT